MDYSTQGFPVLQHLRKIAQTHVHWVADAIQTFHLLSLPSPAHNLSQLQGIFQWTSSSHQAAKVLELQLQHQSFQWIFRVSFLLDPMVWSCYPRDSQQSSPAPQFESINSLVLSLLYGPTLTSIHDYWRNHSLTIWNFSGKVMSLLLNTLSRYVIAFIPRSKRLLISWLQSPPAVILEPKKMKSASTFSPCICHEVMGPDAMILAFLLSILSQLFHSPFSLSSRGSLVTLHFLPLEWRHLHIWSCYFSQQSWFQLVSHLPQHFTWCTLYIS